eukprot:3227777-Rhodomonas_salina.1
MWSFCGLVHPRSRCRRLHLPVTVCCRLCARRRKGLGKLLTLVRFCAICQPAAVKRVVDIICVSPGWNFDLQLWPWCMDDVIVLALRFRHARDQHVPASDTGTRPEHPGAVRGLDLSSELPLDLCRVRQAHDVFEVLCALAIPSLHRKVERCLSGTIANAYVCAVLDQHAAHGQMPVPSCLVQRCITRLIEIIKMDFFLPHNVCEPLHISSFSRGMKHSAQFVRLRSVNRNIRLRLRGLIVVCANRTEILRWPTAVAHFIPHPCEWGLGGRGVCFTGNFRRY